MSVLTPEILAWVGCSAPPRTELATRRDIRKYSIATGQRQRKYLDGDEAPPLYYVALFWDVVERSEMTPDGAAIDRLLPAFPLNRLMNGGSSVVHHARIRPGDTLVGRRTLTDIREKEGRSGPLIFYEVTLEVARESGEPVVTDRTTRILR